MKNKINLFLIIFGLLLVSCNSDKNDLIIQDLKNNDIDTSGLTGNPVDQPSDNSALGTQRISLSVIIDPSFSKPVTRVRVRAFTSRDPVVASTWFDLTASGSTGVFTGTYTAAPNPTTKFGIHAQAFNGSALVGELAGQETEYTNNGDGSTIVGNTITITTAL